MLGDHEKQVLGGVLCNNLLIFAFCSSGSMQWTANYILWAKSSPLLVFENKSLLEHSHINLRIVPGCFHTAMSELSGGDRDHMPYLIRCTT